MVKHWSVTRGTLTLNSGEAELAGIMQGVGEALEIQAFVADVVVQAQISVHTDSSAAIGKCRRRGSGRVQDLAVS